ncbi:MAG: transketolase [Desulfobacula sp.]|uniref:transketolase n=2 Tax=Desulfobacula sp. TaxID=2593537 RepID=UPI001D6BBF43|nr:transketolase [Desulfobacula sp.]MBT3486590.1 transketolase [Desulfobacula sp.]MBT3805751.1 transketolase [Desulfobacula sp.]MBT4023934.1 transketolase [Desulfobacula sp.]MBT4508381.1 transketolase [Desulfobacula sp.]
MAQAQTNIDQLTITTIRTLCMDAVQKANSGHPGAPMGLAPCAYVLFKRFLKHNPKNPAWIDRDRFVLSGGHVSSLIYSLLYLFGYGLEIDDLKNFRQWGSRTPGHPELGHTPGVETTTGPLGQGIANAVGMAVAERHLAARFNMKDKEIINHHTYVMCGDGDLMEGVALETISLAGHLGLGKLICLYDDNSITIEGKTDIAFTEDVRAKFESQNWHVVTVNDGNDLEEIQKAIQAGKDAVARPSLVQIKTHIAYGSPNKQDSSDAHGAPLGVEEIKLVKKFYGAPVDKNFFVPENVLENCGKALIFGEGFEQSWQNIFNDYKKQYPKLAASFVDAISGFLSEGWDAKIPQFNPEDGPVATRAASGQVLNAIADNLPELMGGSADLAPSNKTYINGASDFQKDAYDGRNIRFGVREHAMAAIMSGMYLHSGIRPYGGTFLVFADYMRPAIRMATLMKLPLIYVFTHDSVAVGEDGPTHQPVEHLASLRAIPGLNVVRPADANETALAWKQALKTVDSPTALILSRQKLPTLDVSQRDGEFNYGAYAVKKVMDPDMILIGTGSEVHICVEAAGILKKDHNIKATVVSMPSWELFANAPAPYRERILPTSITKRMAVEAGISMGWEKYTGSEGKIIGIDKFGASAPGGTVLKEYGISVENIVEKALDLLK